MFGKSSGNVWPLPSKPQLKSVEMIPVAEMGIRTNGYYLSSTNALTLANNVDELKAYIQKLEVLINTITKYYGDTIKEQGKN